MQANWLQKFYHSCHGLCKSAKCCWLPVAAGSHSQQLEQAQEKLAYHLCCDPDDVRPCLPLGENCASCCVSRCSLLTIFAAMEN